MKESRRSIGQSTYKASIVVRAAFAWLALLCALGAASAAPNTVDSGFSNLYKAGKYKDALELARRLSETESSLDEMALNRARIAEASALWELGQYRSASALAQKLTEALSEDDSASALRAEAMHWLGVSRLELGDLPGARQALQEALSRASDGRLALAIRLALGRLSRVSGDYPEARAQLEGAIATAGSHSVDPVLLADATSELGRVLYLTAKVPAEFAEARQVLAKAVELRRHALPDSHPGHAASSFDLSRIADQDGDADEKIRQLQRAIEIVRSGRGEKHPDIARAHHNIATAWLARGNYADAEQSFESALRTWRASDLAGTVLHLQTLRVLGLLRRDLGDYAGAISVLGEAVAMPAADGLARHPELAAMKFALGSVLQRQQRWTDAEQHYLDALGIREDVFGESHQSLEPVLKGLAEVNAARGDFATAVRLLERAIEISASGSASAPIRTASLELALSTVLRNSGRLRDAEQAVARARARLESAGLPAGHVRWMSLHAEAAGIAQSLGRTSEAGAHWARVIEVGSQVLGPAHPDVIRARFAMASLLRSESPGKALEIARVGTSAIRQRMALMANTESLVHEARINRQYLQLHIDLRLSGDHGDSRSAFAETFELMQSARASSTSETVAAMAARFASGDDAMAELVRARQEALLRREQLEDALWHSLASAERKAGELPSRLRQELQATANQASALDTRLETEFPRYKELTRPLPATLEEATALLADDEALVAFLVGPEKSWGWLVRGDQARVTTIALGSDELRRMVTSLRGQIDPASVGAKTLQEVDVVALHRLYVELLAPFEDLLVGAAHLVVVPDAEFESLPFSILLTEPPAAGEPDYAKLPWLLRRHAVTVLPSVPSLRALRVFAEPSRAEASFLGFGDPAPIADPLPETAEEVRRVAQLLGDGTERVHLGEAASETMVKSEALARYRVVSFATHAATADGEKWREPGLLLAMPRHSTAEDDGFLSASEIAGLHLDADLVLLSACNTGAGDGGVASEWLSGLARAFFHAGSRSLLVSHWNVDSEAGQRIVTGLFEAARDAHGLRHSEALRRTMLHMLSDPARPRWSHPYYWAAFQMVGDVSGARSQ